MSNPIDREPRPLLVGTPVLPDWPTAPVIHRFRVPEHVPEIGFFEALYGRRSGREGAMDEDGLSAILYHSMRLRERRHDGRFGTWESRSAPSAGGIHGLRPLVVPSDEHSPAGLYDPDIHGLIELGGDAALRSSAQSRRQAMGLSSQNYFIQFVADSDLYFSRYENSRSLFLRDVGALIAIMGLVAAAFDLSCCPLGHLGQDVVAASGLPARYEGAGGIMI